MNIRYLKSELTALLAWFFITGFSTLAAGQAMPAVSVRFANPQFDKETNTYSLDVELRADDSPQALFGMNVRFFYDASLMEFTNLDEFHTGYGILGEAPKPFKGNAASGAQLFGFSEATAYVNGAVLLQNDHSPMEIVGNQWTKAFRANFKVPSSRLEEPEFCPSVIWDLQPQASKGGFLSGSDGLVLTVLEGNPNTREVSAPAQAHGVPFNWQYGAGQAKPYGRMQASNCIPLAQLTTSNNEISESEKGYTLLQNYPNPFARSTMIEFVLPGSRDVTFSFFDAAGRLIKVIQGNYPAGENNITLERAGWMEYSNMIFYRMETSDYISGMRKMTVINP